MRWVFRFGSLHGFAAGNQGSNTRTWDLHVWAVRTGDVQVIPIPAAVWFFASALGMIAGLRSLVRRK